MQDLKTALTGISGILVTPYDQDGDISPKRQKPIVDRAIAAGVHIMVANGNTGEFYALTLDEAEAMVQASAEHVAGRVPLIADVGRGIRDACRLASVSRRAGASALMIHQPPDPFSSPRGLVDYVRTVADAADGLPTVLYLRNDAIGTKAIVDLCGIPSVIGVKWATPNPLKLSEAIAACDPEVVWVGGLAEVWAPTFYAVGAQGFTSGLINVWPQRSVVIHAALAAGDYAGANRLIDGMKAFEAVRAEEMNGSNVTGVKAALALIGHDCGATRPPSAWPLTVPQQTALSTFISDNGISF
ncbi:dihydrodipicolinate synthase family protein [Rhizobium wenxiniae]|uniref:dihydrodipicolinate synthase family protein n=1 Tax=Rhizobium wenxiniae TaxID=1737357 RepID=UPI001C6EE77A|nr:dihydrodipicolinate synthase family protein [Rhizobium wenxiniae]MBW9088584.1 dihydrodipicolinate synthase family protein [Rhizobium wenxiniae]